MSNIKPRLLTPEQVAKTIDHALLKPLATKRELDEAIDILEKYKLRCLILTPTLLNEVAGTTKSCIGAVAGGFPYGYSTIEAKIKEVEDVISYGAREVDYVVNIQNIALGKLDKVVNEAKAVIEICKSTGVTCKIIIEAPAFTPSTVYQVAYSIAQLQPDYIKTSTGHGPRPTTIDDIVIIRKAIEDANAKNVGIKAAGGIRTALQAITLLEAGANIIGTSTPVQIIEGVRKLREILSQEAKEAK